jgi:hypothetical protein
MATYPVRPRSALLEWSRVHDPIFHRHWNQIGLGKTQVVIFRAAMASAAAATLAQERLQQAALVATGQVEQSFAALAVAAGDAIRSIRAFAGTSGDPAGVYSLARIPPLAAPSPIPPPGRPGGLTVRLNAASGSLTLRWKATNPANARRTTYIIRRKLPGETEFAFIGVAGKKCFVDETLPAGRESVQYTVQGQRANLSGPVSPIFNVNFGKSAIQSKAGGQRGTIVASVSSQVATPGAWDVEIPAAARA